MADPGTATDLKVAQLLVQKPVRHRILQDLKIRYHVAGLAYVTVHSIDHGPIHACCEL